MVNNKEVKRRKSKKKRRDLTPFIIIGVLAVVVLGVIFLSTYKPVAEVINQPSIPPR
jgi:putative flippase GtrA